MSSPLLPDEVRQLIGDWGPVTKAYPVSLADIQRWAMNVYWPEPPPRLYWDAEYAATTRWGGIIAPQEFNPFAWVINDGGPAREEAGSILRRRGFAMLNGGQFDRFGVVMRPGDIIASRSRLLSCEEKQIRFGPALFLTSEVEWTNQNGELVRLRHATSVAHSPAAS